MSHPSTCGNERSGRSDQRCAECQNAQRRATKQGRNNYKADKHGVGHWRRDKDGNLIVADNFGGWARLDWQPKDERGFPAPDAQRVYTPVSRRAM